MCVDLINRVPGKLYLIILFEVDLYDLHDREKTRNFLDFLTLLRNVIYIHQHSAITKGYFFSLPSIVSYTSWDSIHADEEKQCQHVLYQPSLLNGRHIVDVLRAVSGAVDVSEAVLDRAKEQATRWALNVKDDRWHTYWYPDVVGIPE